MNTKLLPHTFFLGTIAFLLFYVCSLKARTIEFAGREWIVKSGYGGPGPNYWSDSNENVWLDGNGWLHLKIRYSNGTWYCSEVYTTELTQYGIHRFYIIDRLDSLDRNVVFAPFLYSDDTTEVDIEFAKWGITNPLYNAYYVVQPGQNPGNVERFWIALNGDYTTHYMNWQLDSIRFKSIHGHYQEPPDPGFLIHEWLYTGSDIPLQEEHLRIHINLWLHQGIPPSDGEEVEVVVKDADLPPALGIDKIDQTVISRQPSLTISYPNPVVSKTTIKYFLPKESDVELKIYDINGRKIAVLANGKQESGHHEIIWDIGDFPVKQLPNGIYFYRLEAGDFTDTKKMIVVR